MRQLHGRYSTEDKAASALARQLDREDFWTWYISYEPEPIHPSDVHYAGFPWALIAEYGEEDG